MPFTGNECLSFVIVFHEKFLQENLAYQMYTVFVDDILDENMIDAI